MTHFGDRLAGAVAARESQIVLGLDPDPAKLWPVAADADSTADRVRKHCIAAIDAAGPACVATKPQLACFERLGAPGWAALKATCDHAREQGLLVLADAKRGDIDVSAKAYAQALVGPDADGLQADAFTANPYLGADTLRPMIDIARPNGRGVIVLVRTSNPGAADFQDARLESGETVWERVAATVDGLGREALGPESGLADVCAVTGATVPEHLVRLRELMPHTPFLIPGVGAQGGKVEDLAPAFACGRAGGVINASRGIVNAFEKAGGDPAEAARAEAERLRATAWGLGG